MRLLLGTEMSLLCGSHHGSREKPRHCRGSRSRGGWGGEGFETSASFGQVPNSGRALQSADHPRVPSRFPCAGPERQSPTARTSKRSAGDQHLCLPAVCRVEIFVVAAGLPRNCLLPAPGGQEGRLAGRRLSRRSLRVGFPRRVWATRDSACLQFHPPTAQPQAGPWKPGSA